MFVPDRQTPLLELNIPGDEVIHGQITIDTPGSAKPLYSSAVTIKSGVIIRALSTNADKIYVGGSNVTTSNGHQLVKGESTSVAIKDLSSVYITGLSAGDGVSFLSSV